MDAVMAVLDGELPMLQRAIADGVDINYPAGCRDGILLAFATECPRREVAEWLLANGARWECIREEDVRRVCLRVCTQKGRLDWVVQMLRAFVPSTP